MKRKYIIISIILFIMGLASMIFAFNLPKKETSKDIQENEVKEQENNNTLDIPLKPKNNLDNDGLFVLDFKQAEEMVENDKIIKITFILYNSLNNNVTDKVISLKFYQNNQVRYTYEYNIDNLKPGEQKEITYEDNVSFEGKLECAIVYNDYQLLKFTKEEFEKKYGPLGTTITREKAIEILNENLKK